MATAASALALIVIGGLVHPTGSSLSCPDWPLCNGQVLPPMKGTVAYELAHRIAAFGVALMTAVLAALVVRHRADPRARRLAVGAVALVAAEAAVGAIAVVYRLPLLASVTHLALSMAFLAVTVALASRLGPPAPAPAAPRPRALPGVAAAAAFGSVVLGAFVRHAGAALACEGLVLCGGTIWPDSGVARLQMAHRLWNWMLAALVAATALRTVGDRASPRRARVLAAAAPALLVVQGLLGMATVGTAVSVPFVSLHLAVAALVIADLVALFTALSPRGAPEERSVPGAAEPSPS